MRNRLSNSASRAVLGSFRVGVIVAALVGVATCASAATITFNANVSNFSTNNGTTRTAVVGDTIVLNNISSSSWQILMNTSSGTPGNTFTSPLIPSGGSFSFTVVDSAPFVVNVTFYQAGVRRTAGTFVTIEVPLATNTPPTANAGTDFSVSEGQSGVTLNGSLSSDPDADPLSYSWTQLPGGPVVTLSDPSAAQPTFTAPTVALGGETLSFELTVTDNLASSTDTVSITVVNVNHTPVADAGSDQSVAEGAPVALNGAGSFDIDLDAITYAWVQEAGPAVDLTGANTMAPGFTAPTVGAGGAPGVVATLVFRLVVDDGFPADAAPDGYTTAQVADTVTIDITNVNNVPSADAGSDLTLNENREVLLNGGASSDPDSDPLTYAWVQIDGPAVDLAGADTATPSFTTPFVNAGGADLTFVLTVDDGYGSTVGDTVVIHVQNANDPPLVSAALPTNACLWPPNHRFVLVGITGVSDPEANATITIDRVTQDEPTNGRSDGDTPIDAVIQADGTVLLRAERAGKGDGRVYHIHFTATDLEGSASGIVTVAVPHNRTGCRSDQDCPAIDGGPLFDSTISVPFEREHAKGHKKDDDHGKKASKDDDHGKKDNKKDDDHGKKDSKKDDDHGKKDGKNDSKKGKK